MKAVLAAAVGTGLCVFAQPFFPQATSASCTIELRPAKVMILGGVSAAGLKPADVRRSWTAKWTCSNTQCRRRTELLRDWSHCLTKHYPACDLSTPEASLLPELIPPDLKHSYHLLWRWPVCGLTAGG